MKQIMTLEKYNLEAASMNIFHEIDESFSAMEIVQETPLKDATRNVYIPAHNRAVSHDKNFKNSNYKLHMQTGVEPNILWLNPNPLAKFNDSGWIKLN